MISKMEDFKQRFIETAYTKFGIKAIESINFEQAFAILDEMNDNEYIKAFTIRNVSKRYGFEKTEFHEGMSFVLDCSFYKTKYDDIYITDYDFRNLDDLEKKGLSMLFYRKCGVMNTQMISNELLKDETAFNYALDSFKNECSNVC